MLGGGFGAICRYWLFLIAQRVPGQNFPWGTLAVNLLGCLLIGLLWSLFDRFRITNEMRLFIFTGFLGGFTTFSTFTRETVQLVRVGLWKSAVAYMVVSNVLGILLVVCGYLLSKKVILNQ